MSRRKYYSARLHGSALDLDHLKELFLSRFWEFKREGYFQESMGYSCVDAGDVPGTMGPDIHGFFFRALKKRNIYPFGDHSASWTEEDLFDVIEVLHDLVSKPVEGSFHSWSDCGWHYHTFDVDAGHVEYRDEVNHFLGDYQGGYELSPDGEMLHQGDASLRSLLDLPLPAYDPPNVEQRVEAAKRKFMRYRSSADDRRDAVKSLADVLEFLRPQVKAAMLKADERDLFNIANSFGIRHHNREQRTDYDPEIWLPWMFYVYLATIHAVLQVTTRDEQGRGQLKVSS